MQLDPTGGLWSSRGVPRWEKEGGLLRQISRPVAQNQRFLSDRIELEVPVRWHRIRFLSDCIESGFHLIAQNQVPV